VGFYQVSDGGQVRSVERELTDKRGRTCRYTGRVLKPNDVGGYAMVRFSKNNTFEDHRVHTLVLLAFRGDQPAGMQCRHLNGNSWDNRLENLCYGTISENTYDQVRHGTHQAARKTHCLNGHLFDESNTRINQKGSRVCRTCMRGHQRAYKRRKVVFV
jgi:hypothetical protein